MVRGSTAPAVVHHAYEAFNWRMLVSAP